MPLLSALMSMLGIDCCNQHQVFFLVTFGCYLVGIRIAWRSAMLRPFKLWTVLTHELPKAVLAWLLGCHVEGIEISGNRGTTHWTCEPYRYRWVAPIILNAGYVGSAAFGFLIICSVGDRDFARAVSIGILVILGACASYLLDHQCEGYRGALLFTIVFFGSTIGFLTVLTFVNILLSIPSDFWNILLVGELLFIGVLNLLYALLQIYDDTLGRKNPDSDAYHLANTARLPCFCHTMCVGVVYLAATALLFFVGVLYVLRAETADNSPFTDVDHWLTFVPGPLVLSLLTLGSITDVCSGYKGDDEGGSTATEKSKLASGRNGAREAAASSRGHPADALHRSATDSV